MAEEAAETVEIWDGPCAGKFLRVRRETNTVRAPVLPESGLAYVLIDYHRTEKKNDAGEVYFAMKLPK